MLKNGLICLISIVFFALFVVSRTEKKTMPLNQTQSRYKILSVTLDKPLIKLGALVPQSDKKNELAALINEALKLATADLQGKNLKYRYQLIPEYLSAMPDNNHTVAIRHFTQEKVDAFIGYDARTQKALKPLLDKENIPYVNMPLIPFDNPSDASILQTARPETVARGILALLHKKGCRRVVFVGQETLKNAEFEKELMNEALTRKMVIKRIWINRGRKEALAAFHKAQNFNPDGYIILLDLQERVDFMRSYSKVFPLLPIVHADILNGFEAAEYEGLYFVDIPGLKESFAGRLKVSDKSPHDKKIMASVYDSVMLAVQAFEKTEHKKAAAARIKQLDKYAGVSGEFVKTANGSFVPRPVIKKIINAKAYILQEP